MDRRTAVIGATSDYIDLIQNRLPGRAIFLTNRGEREKASEPKPDARNEVTSDLISPEAALSALKEHVDRWDVQLSGIACFDCESLLLAARAANLFDLPFPTLEAVSTCRDKFKAKSLWRQRGLPCPDAMLIQSADEALRFHKDLAGQTVLKPLTGSGSELVFVCSSEAECSSAYQNLQRRLTNHSDVRLYPRDVSVSAPGRGPSAILEEFITGEEFSCDFILDRGLLEVIRFAEKIPARFHSPGTALAYIVPGRMPQSFDALRFNQLLLDAAHSLGIRRALCMADFILRDGQPVLLEITPRPGGDCLPSLIRQSCGLDMLAATLDFADGLPLNIPPHTEWKRLVGLRLFADCAGIIRHIDCEELQSDPRVCECVLSRSAGHSIVMPPEDYSSRLIGHVLFEPRSDSIESECVELAALLNLEIENL